MVVAGSTQSILGEHRWLWLAAVPFLLAAFSHAATALWTPGGVNINWSTPGNWLGGQPAPSVDVIFLTNGAVLNSASNNVVSSSVTISSLNYNHTNAASGTQTYHNTYLGGGVTLTITNGAATNAVFVGSNLSLTETSTRASISGADGSLVVLATNGAFAVRQGGSQNYTGTAVLDLSGLGNCTVQARQLLIAGDGTNGDPTKDRPSATLKLARNNHLYLTSPSYPPALTTGFNIGNTANGCALVLGQTNYVFCDAGMGVGMARIQSSVTFGGFSNSLAVFRDSSGIGRQNYWLIGDAINTGFSGIADSGSVDFSGGTLDAQVGLVVVGRGISDTRGNTNGGTLGSLTFNAGTLDVNTLVVGYQVNSNSSRVIGTVNVDGSARIQVNNAIQLGRFLPAVASNGVSSVVINIGTISGGGAVTVNGSITTTPSLGSPNDSEIVVRNGGSLSARSGIGPLLRLELNNCSLGLDFASATNPTTHFCYVTNLTISSPVTLAIAGSRLTNGQITLFKYKNLVGTGFAGITSLTFSNSLAGFLLNNVANSSIDLVITASNPNTNTPPVITPRLKPPVYADYGSVVRETSARADGYLHVNTPYLIQKLVSGNIKTYAFLVWNANGYKTDWDDFRLEFLPAAQATGINVWLYLTPPTENSPPAAYMPFADDYYSWMTAAAQLSLRYPVLKAVVIDDYNSNLGLFTPDYVHRITDAALDINTNFMFMVINYDLSHGWASYTQMISPAFMNNYGSYLGSVIFPYLHWGNRTTSDYNDYSDAASQIAINNDIVGGRLAQFAMRTSSGPSAGNYGAASLVLTNATGVFPDVPYPFQFRVSNWPTNPGLGNLVFELRVDGTLVWSKDQASFYGVVDITTNLQNWVKSKSSPTVMVREYANNSVSTAVGSSWNLPSGNWVRSETGAFVGKTVYYPASTSNVPMVVMIYDGGYSSPAWYPSTNYVHDVNVIAQASVQAGQAVGIIQYSMDKTASSPQWPIIQQLYGQWAYQPQFNSIQRQPDGSVVVRGNSGGPNIGYTLKAANSLTTPIGSWTTISSNAFDAGGNFTNTDNTASGQPARFYRISVP
jgi:hypothetical protein